MSGIIQGLIGSLKSTAAVIKDSFFNNVTLLLNTTNTSPGTNNTFEDSTGINTIGRSGNATQGTFSPFSQTGWSNYFSAISSYVSFPSNAAYGVGTGNFCVEFFLFATATIGTTKPFTVGSSGAEQIAVTMTASSIRLDIAGSQIINTSFTTPLNSWVHIAFVRSATITDGVALYVNGTRITTGTSSGSVAANNVLFGGIDWSASLGLIGYYSNVRYSNTDRGYTGATITVPSAPFVRDVNTLVLTAQSNRFFNDSSIGGTATTNLASVQAFSPFAPSVPYSTTTIGGSLVLDGSSDLLTVADNFSLQFDGAFTINLWFYRRQTGTNSIIGKGTSSTGYLLSINTSNQFVYTDGSTQTISAATVPLNAWTYLSVVRSGLGAGQVAVYVNAGTPVTGTSSTNFVGITNPLYIGATRGGANAINAFMSGIEIYKGVAITPTLPTAPPTYVPSTNQSLVMNFTNFSLYDATAKNNLETLGISQIINTQTKFSTTSLECRGSGNYVQIVEDSPNLQMATGDFTIEGWFYLSSVGVSQGILSKGSGTTTGWSVNITSTNRLQFSHSNQNLTGTTTVSLGSSAGWYYFAVVRSGTASGNLKLYLGTTGAVSTENTSGTAITTDFSQTNPMYVGALRAGGTSSNLNGFLEQIRITKGVARTITTVPTAAFPVQ